MGRAERRREERERRRDGGAPASNVPGWSPPVNMLRSARFVPNTPEENEKQRQDFLAGTLFAQGAGHMFPTGGDGTPPMVTAVFSVFVAEDDQTFAVAPQLREAFRLLDQHSGSELHERLTVGTSWGALDGEKPLAKLKLEFHDQPPLRGKVDIVLLAENYRDSWRHIAGGGLIAVTSLERMQRASSAPDASYGSAMDAALLFGIGSSPAIQHLITTHGW
jgi:hypothetical protein